ncbi:COL6A [Mytilus edulis]|uniref:COL6A n=1 Tax=Mytilus edulis TaxID=6550 RepID=A0A8S3UD20_MYTED|nr:COL6A [Mytilus edulis]
MITYEDKNLTDKIDIVNCLNDHFSSVGEKLIPHPHSNFESEKINNYVKSKINDNTLFSLYTVTNADVFKYLSNLDINKSTGTDGVGPRILKVSKSILVDSLTHIINLSLCTGIFPDILNCHDSKIKRNGYDLVVILDSSVSQEYFDWMTTFTKNLADTICFDDGEFKIGLLRYSRDSNVQFNLNDYQSSGNRAETDGIQLYVIGLNINDSVELDETSSHPLTTYQYLIKSKRELEIVPPKIYADLLGTIPTVRVLSTRYHVKHRASVTLECVVDSYPSHTEVTWYRVTNGGRTEVEKGTDYCGSTVIVPSLTINRADLYDNGNYVCTAENVAGVGSSEATRVIVSGVATTVNSIETGYDLVVILDSSVSQEYFDWMTTFTKNLLDTICFYHEEFKIGLLRYSTDSNVQFNLNDYQSSGNLRKAVDNVSYQGGITNTAQAIDTARIQMFRPDQGDRDYARNFILLVTGQDKSLSTNSTWRAAERAETDGIQLYVIGLNINDSVELDETSSHPLTTYQYLIKSKRELEIVPPKIYADLLRMSKNPPSMRQRPTIPTVKVLSPRYPVKYGTTVTLECVVNSNPPHTEVTWYRVINGSRTQVEKVTDYCGSTVNVPSLTINRADLYDNGNYVCTAENVAGVGSSDETRVIVSGACGLTKVDIVIILDSSASVSDDNYQKMKNFCKDFLKNADLDSRNIQVGIVSYSSSVHIEFQMNDYTTSQDIMDAIDAIPYRNGSKNTADGLRIMRSQMFTASNGDRDSVPNVVLILTDGWSNTTSRGTIFEAEQARAEGVHIYCIGIGLRDTSEFNDMASEPASENSFHVQEFDDLAAVGDQVFQALCLVKPDVFIKPNKSPVLYGEPVTIECTVKSDIPVKEVTWYRVEGDSRTPVVQDGRKYSGSTVRVSYLTINHANFQDEGTYVCTAENAAGVGSSTNGEVDITGAQPVVSIPKREYTGDMRTEVTLECVVVANPPETTVYWRREYQGEMVDVGTRPSRFSRASPSSPSLTIRNLDTSDTGMYQCFADNPVGTGQSQQTSLRVLSQPVVSIPKREYTGDMSTQVTLECVVVANPPETTVYWRREDRGEMVDVDTRSSRYSRASPSSPSLTITNLDTSDTGMYQCFADNPVGTGQSQQTSLRVLLPITIPVTATPCGQAKFDIVIILDSSTSVGHDNYQQMKNFCKDFLKNADLDSGNIQVGIVSYSTGVHIEFQMNDYCTSQDIMDAIDAIPYRYGSTNTADGLRTMRSQMFTSRNGDRDGVPNVVIILTDGVSNINSRRTIPEAEQARAAGIHIYAVGIGLRDTRELDAMASEPASENSFNVQSFDELAVLSDQVFQTFCPVATTVKPPEPGYDLVVILDSSVSQEYFDWMTTFTKNLADTVSIDDDEFRVGLLRYSTDSNVQFNLKDYQSSGDVQNAVDQVRFRGGVTNTAQAIDTARTQMFRPDQGDRDYARNFILLITGQDKSLSTNDAWRAAERAETDGIQLYVMGLNINDLPPQIYADLLGMAKNPPPMRPRPVKPDVDIEPYRSTVMTVLYGGPVTIECTVRSGIPVKEVTWYRVQADSRTSVVVDGRKYSGSTVRVPSLTINSANCQDAGTYVCTAENAAGVGSSHNGGVDVTGALPVVTVPRREYSRDLGTELTLECDVVANPPETIVYWRRKDRGEMVDVDTTSSRYSRVSPSSPSLTVKNLDTSDTGMYQCFADNPVGTGQSQQTSLRVLLPITLPIIETTETVATTEKPRKTGYDLVIILDSSVSQEYFDLMKTFTKHLAYTISIDDQEFRVGLLIYSTDSKVQFNLKDYQSSANVKHAVDMVQYRIGLKDTAKAIDTARTQMFRPDQGDRDYARNFILLITGQDKSLSTNDAWRAAERAETDGIETAWNAKDSFSNETKTSLDIDTVLQRTTASGQTVASNHHNHEDLFIP